VALLLCSGSIFSFADALQPYELEYKAEIEGFNVTTIRSLKVTGDKRYQLAQRSKAFLVSLDEVSDFHINAQQQLITENYSYSRRAAGFSKKYNVEFAKNGKNAEYREKKNHKSIQSDEYLFSLLSYQTEIRRQLLAGNQQALKFEIIDKDRSRDYTFSYVGEQTISTALGNIQCVKIQRLRSSNKSNKHTVIWLAKDWGYSIVKIEHSEDGKLKYHLDLESGKVGGEAIHGDKS
jgi:hypothetical protein